MLTRRVKAPEIRSPISAIPSHLQGVQSPKPRRAATVSGSRPGSPFSPRSTTASPSVLSQTFDNSTIPPPPPKDILNLDIDLIVTSIPHSIIQRARQIQIDFLLACRSSLNVPEKNHQQLQFVIQFTRPPLKSSMAVVNTAEIASLLNSPPPLPSKQVLAESPISDSNTSLDELQLPSPIDNELPANIDPEVISLLGNSVEVLPPMQLDDIPGQAKREGQISFSATYTAIRTGVTTIGGIRLFVIEDVGSRNTPRLLRKWDSIADLWIRA